MPETWWLRAGLEQHCFRCDGWHVLISANHGAPASSGYLFVNCPGQHSRFPPGKYFAGQDGAASKYPVRQRVTPPTTPSV